MAQDLSSLGCNLHGDRDLILYMTWRVNDRETSYLVASHSSSSLVVLSEAFCIIAETLHIEFFCTLWASGHIYIVGKCAGQTK